MSGVSAFCLIPWLLCEHNFQSAAMVVAPFHSFTDTIDGLGLQWHQPEYSWSASVSRDDELHGRVSGACP